MANLEGVGVSSPLSDRSSRSAKRTWAALRAVPRSRTWLAASDGVCRRRDEDGARTAGRVVPAITFFPTSSMGAIAANRRAFVGITLICQSIQFELSSANASLKLRHFLIAPSDLLS